VVASFIIAILECIVFFIIFFFFMLFPEAIPNPGPDKIPPLELHASVVFLPVLLLLMFILVFGVSLALAGAYVFYRDLKEIWEVLLLAGFFLTPVFYPIDILPQAYLPYFTVNPVYRIIYMGRQTILYGAFPELYKIFIASMLIFIVFLVGYIIFKKAEPNFGDEV
jgi:ABC-type polysaccharide/polyol phosphate export permease